MSYTKADDSWSLAFAHRFGLARRPPLGVRAVEDSRVIEVSDLSKRFGDRWAVERLSFSAPPGAVTGFLGPNGAGKTTAFRMLLGLAAPNGGTAHIEGRPYADLVEPRRTVGAVLESAGFHPGRTGRDHLRVIATGAGLGRERTDELLGVVGLSGAADRRVGEYSLGMRQRLSLASAMLGDPRVIVLDEPTNGLDPEGVAWLRALMRDWAADGRTVLVASHLLAEVAQAVDRVVIIDHGRVVHESAVDDLCGADVVIVRCADPDAFARELTRTGADVSTDAARPGTLVVHGWTTERVGQAAAFAGIALFELTSRAASSSLERLFLDLTGTPAAVTPVRSL